MKAAMRTIIMSPEFHTLGDPEMAGQRPATVEKTPHQSRSYKAMVLLYLNGGADTFNLLVPTCASLWEEYTTVRQNLALGQGQLLGISANTQSCNTFGVHHGLPFVRDLYAQGQLAFVSNIGGLVQPTTKDGYMGTTPQCAGLFSHLDQQIGGMTLQCQVQGASPRGFGGRLADAAAAEGHRTTSFSLAGANTWSTGRSVGVEIIDGRNGAVRLQGYQDLQAIVGNTTSLTYGNVYCEEYAQQFAGAIESSEKLGTLLDSATLTTTYGTSNSLARQLHQVARLISTRAARGAERDFFFAELGGFDTHNALEEVLETKFAEINAALEDFVAELKGQSIFDSVVLVTSSDFGRTLTSNGRGSDHGWAGNHLVLGGSVNGGRIFNRFPESLLDGNSQDAGRGRMIPQYPWENVMVPIAQWMCGQSSSRASAAWLHSVFPNLANFNASEHIIHAEALFAGFELATPSPTPSGPTASPTPSPSPPPSPSPTPGPTASPSPSPTADPTATPSPTPTCPAGYIFAQPHTKPHAEPDTKPHAEPDTKPHAEPNSDADAKRASQWPAAAAHGRWRVRAELPECCRAAPERAPWSAEFKYIQQMEQRLKATEAELRKVKSGNSDKSQEESAAAQDPARAKRAKILKQIEVYEKVVRDTAEFGGAVHDANKAALEDLRAQAKALRPPATAHKTAMQKLEKSKQQLVRQQNELEELQRKMAQLQQDISGKESAIIAKTSEVKILQQEVAESAAKLNPQQPSTNVKDEALDEETFKLDTETEEVKAAPEPVGFYAKFSADPVFTKYQQFIREKFKKKDVPMPQAEQQQSPPAAGTDASNKRGTDDELNLQEAQELWNDLQSDAAQGDEATKLLELINKLHNAKRSRTRSPDHGAPGQYENAPHIQVDVPGWPTLSISNIYIHTCEGMTVRNATILARVGEEMAGLTHPALIEGGWNMSTDVVEESTFPLHAHVETTAPKEVTCRTPTSAPTIDYFAPSEAAMLLFRTVTVDAEWHIKPHRPVHLHMAAVGKPLQVLTYGAAPKLSPVIPEVDFASYIDDSSMGVESADRSSVVSLAVEAGKGFLETAAALGATINEKFAVLANTRELAEEVAIKLGFSADKAVTSTTYLGTDQAAGCFIYEDSDTPELDPGVEAHLVTPECEDIDAEPEQLAEQLVQGDRLEFAVDGSCSKPSLVTLQRAGWAVVLVNPTADTPVAVMCGAVPRAMPQSSAMAEFLSMAFVGQIADRPSTVYADFMAVVKAALKSKQEQLQAKSMYSCVQFFGHQMRGYDNIQSVRHVKAHKSGEQYQALSDEDRRITDANAVADVFAKKAALLHPSASPEFLVRVEDACTQASHFVKLCAHVLPCLELEERFSRLPVFERSRHTMKDNWHDWCSTSIGIQCSQCPALFEFHKRHSIESQFCPVLRGYTFAQAQCECSARTQQWASDYPTVEACGAKCASTDGCMAFGSWTTAPVAGWCALYDSACGSCVNTPGAAMNAYNMCDEGAAPTLPDAEPHDEPHDESHTEPHGKPFTEPNSESHNEPLTEPNAEPDAKPHAEPHSEPDANPNRLSNRMKAERHADDFLIIGPSDEVDKLLEVMGERLKLSYVVKLTKKGDQATLLSTQVEKAEDGYTISGKTSLTDDILKELGLETAKPSVLPETKDEVHMKSDEVYLDVVGHSRYRTRVGKLLKLASHRPDIQHGVGVLSRGMSGPTEKGLGRSKKMARYLAGTRDYKVQLVPNKGGIAVECWVDGDWADDKTDRISTSSGILKYHGFTVLSWSRRKGCVALSSAESELYALGSGAAEALGLASLLEEWKAKTVPLAMSDSSSAVHIVKKRGPGTMKHVEIRFLALQTWREQGRLHVGKVCTHENPSDMMTKPTTRKKVEKFTEMVGLVRS
ncbi:unnamed protein product [Prorocentrum cordatum]|uniref:Uncharacterized protein n=1 Tax=Prorocentrum cordatum TaxID=2364126 RepID=A0ABN9U7E3_9DINO|nr:unnamed protein product [Polarella glacialis]